MWILEAPGTPLGALGEALGTGSEDTLGSSWGTLGEARESAGSPGEPEVEPESS